MHQFHLPHHLPSRWCGHHVSQHLASHLVFQEGLRKQLLQPGIFGLELIQALCVRHAPVAELAPPDVIACFREPVPPAQVLHGEPRLGPPRRKPTICASVNRFFIVRPVRPGRTLNRTATQNRRNVGATLRFYRSADATITISSSAASTQKIIVGRSIPHTGIMTCHG